MGEDLAATRVLVATILTNVGLAGVVGGWASVLWLHRPASAWAEHAHRRSRGALNAALAFTIVSDMLLLWLQAAYMGQTPLAEAWGKLPSIAVDTHVGRAWMGGMAALLVLLAITWRFRHRVGVGTLSSAAMAISVFIYSRAAVSHAAVDGLMTLQLLVEFAHLWAISLWLGAVGIAAFVVLAEPMVFTNAERSDLAEWVRTLSTVATAAFAVVLGSGVFNSWRRVGTLANLFGTAYGNALLIKVALVAIAVALGGLNRFSTMPALLAALESPSVASGSSQGRFLRILRIEAFVLLAALIGAAVLSTSPLPMAS